MSEKKLAIKLSTLEGIGDAVRSKEGSTEPIPVNALAERITALPIASGDDNLAKLAKGTLTELTAKDLEGVTSIPAYFMYEAPDSLKKLTLPDGLTKIGDNGFSGVKLENLSIPYSLVDLGSTFYGGIIGNTENLYYRGNIDAYLGTIISMVSRKNVYINNELIQHLVLDNYPSKKNARGSTKYTNGYRISNFAFRGCESLLSFTSCAGRLQSGKMAFAYCTNLTKVTFRTKDLDYSQGSGSNPKYSMDSDLFTGCTALTDIYVPWSEGEIDSAPWGATNATIHYNSPIPFTIDGIEYQCLLGQSWEAWINSEYNTGGFYFEGSYVRTPDGKYLYYLNLSSVLTKLHTNGGVSRVLNFGTAYFSQEG